jgi:DNA-binding NarL/FixJ family response regulator
LISTALPDDGTLQLTRLVTRGKHCSPVIIAGEYSARLEMVRYFEAGAMGFLPLSAPPEEAAANIVAVAQGEALLPPDVAAAVMRRLAEVSSWMEEIKPIATAAETLTRREREILRLIGREFTNQDIANHLIIEVGTVKNHVHNILAKLKVNSRHEAAQYSSLIHDRPRPTRLPISVGRGLEQYFS